MRRSPLLVCALLAAGCAARRPPAAGTPETTAEAGVTLYSNDDGLLVTSPWVQASQVVSGPVSVNAGWTADLISAATVDIVTHATAPFRETRNEARLGLGYDDREVRGGLGYFLSTEHDTDAHTLSVNGELDLFDRNLTLGMAYGLALYRVGQHGEPRSLWDGRTVHQIDATATQVLSRSTVASLTYTLQELHGDLSSAYLMVPLYPAIEDLWDRPHAQWVHERHPSTRWRHAVGLAGRHALTERIFLRAKYRGYLDSWSMRGNTGELGIAVDLGRGVTVEALDRLHWQSSVSFYRSIYTVNREYITNDRRLGELMTNITTLAVRPHLDDLELVFRSELHWTHYADHKSLLADDLRDTPDVWAIVGQVGVGYQR